MDTGGPGGRIHLLDPETIRQIAAGEVVERPSSVIKELVENSLDAGAQTVEVEILTREKSIWMIRVTDDGCGMSPEDAVLAFTRHATSKITGIDDLANAGTLGFRGEALASIAAVSATTLTTRLRGGGPGGARVVYRGGTCESRGECGCPEGTTVEVSEIFFNIPARAKFQKSLQGELASISTVLESIILSNPTIGFHYLLNGKERLSIAPGGGLVDRVGALFGTDVARRLIPVREQREKVSVGGVISHPSITRSNPYQVLISVNGRSIYSRPLIAAVKEGYGSLLPADRYPVAVLELTIPRDEIDVNVHPSKRQIRISGEREVASGLSAMIRNALRTQDLRPRDVGLSADTLPGQGWKGPLRYEEQGKGPVPGVREMFPAALRTTDQQLRQTELAPPGPDHIPLIPEMECLGQLGDSYILAATARGELVIIDQHAAHERIFYDQVTEATRKERISQDLLVPVVLEFSPREADILRTAIPRIKEEGFGIEEFGKDSFAVGAIPVILGRCEDPGVIREILAEIIRGEGSPGMERERICRIIACRGALKAGTVCTSEQCTRLIRQLARTRDPWTCPHGRPTMIAFSRERLDKLFGRT
ncbi:DNA mismatch repair protein MutL [Methanolinea mesophila]|uniref:DNA mismatch repair endonuclease MutL n=1 Tax=Methanolinea mesophila TaxID=547055 RepID=UPI001AE501DA|nr:DNA mismatch repair endonuclease MutL [Methanolinea mesophila]MBP1929597.1 DNA mismatch repair protein MutL [Methanolinea mesophila]